MKRLLILFAFFCVHLSFAQVDSTQRVLVHTTDGQERIGFILFDDGHEVLLKTETIGLVYIRKETITSILALEEEETEEYEGEYRASGPFTTRYYLTTNSLPVKKSEDYSMIHLYGPEVHFSVSNRVSVGIMTSWIASPFVLATKYSIPTKNPNINFGIGALVGSSGYLNTFRGYGALPWGMVTFGNRLKNITFSAGYSFVQPGFRNDTDVPGTYAWDTEWNVDSTYSYQVEPSIPSEETPGASYSAPVLSIAGITKVGKHSSFFFDSMIFFYTKYDPYGTTRTDTYDYTTGSFAPTVVTKNEEKTSGVTFILMPGMRFQKRENRAFQVVLAGFSRITDGKMLAFPVPMCSWLLKF